MTTPHPIAAAAAELVKQIDLVNTPDHRQDLDSPAIGKIIVTALQTVNESGANFLCKLSPAQARQILRQRHPRRRHDDDDVGPDNDDRLDD